MSSKKISKYVVRNTLEVGRTDSFGQLGLQFWGSYILHMNKWRVISNISGLWSFAE